MGQRFNRGARRARRAKKVIFLCVLCGLCGLPFVTAFAQPPQPAFKSSVEVTSVDVTVVDTNGRPITNLTPADFAVRIDNNLRHVVTAEWVQLTSRDDKPAPIVAPPDGYSTNENSIGGRLIVMAIDQPNIRFGGAMAIARAANGFVDRGKDRPQRGRELGGQVVSALGPERIVGEERATRTLFGPGGQRDECFGLEPVGGRGNE